MHSIKMNNYANWYDFRIKSKIGSYSSIKDEVTHLTLTL